MQGHIGIDGAHLPFGKYRDQPLQVLQHDIDYCRWLLSTDWFPERYAALAVLVKGIVREEQYKTEEAKRERLEMVRQHAQEAEALVNAKPGPALCVVFARIQQYLDDEKMCSEYRNNWVEELFKIAGQINNDEKLGKAFAAIEADLGNMKLRDLAGLMLKQVVVLTKAKTGTVVDLRSRNVVAMPTRKKSPFARPRPPAA